MAGPCLVIRNPESLSRLESLFGISNATIDSVRVLPAEGTANFTVTVELPKEILDQLSPPRSCYSCAHNRESYPTPMYCGYWRRGNIMPEHICSEYKASWT